MILIESEDSVACEAKETNRTKNPVKNISMLNRMLLCVLEFIDALILLGLLENSSFFETALFKGFFMDSQFIQNGPQNIRICLNRKGVWDLEILFGSNCARAGAGGA
jgi:hypothetical protein